MNLKNEVAVRMPRARAPRPGGARRPRPARFHGRWLWVWCCLGLVLCGCARSTIATRKQERPAAYAGLTPEQRQAVDAGQVKVGMSMDAVYLAWGRPSQVLTGESAAGPTITWLYHDTAIVEYRYWAFHRTTRGPYCYTAPEPAFDFGPLRYLRAEVVFENGRVRSWRVLEPPGQGPWPASGRRRPLLDPGPRRPEP